MGTERRAAVSPGSGKPPRKHVRTGRKPPGRPPGSRDVLPRGAVAAIKALKLRVPADATPETEELAAEALATTVEIMRSGYRQRGAMFRLMAAKDVRTETCGPVAQKVEHSGTVTHAHLVSEAAKPPEGST